MGKISLQDIASRLVDRRQLSKKQASQFVNEMFLVIQQSLNQDKLVKVKGLGTFRIIDVEDRESVDVNTGDRVLIEGHGKITFTPDALMKELVNKPFSQFETVVLNDGVDFNDATDAEEPAEEPAVSEQAEEPVTVESAEGAPVALPVEETYDNPSVAPLVDFVTDSNVPAPSDVGETPASDAAVEDTAIEETATEELDEELQESDVEPERRSLSWPMIALAACGLGFILGFFVGREFGVKPWTPEQTIPEQTVVEKPVQPAKQKVTKDSVKVAEAPVKATEAPVKPAEPVAKPAETPVKPSQTVSKPAETQAKATETPVAAPSSQPELDKYEQMDARVRTGGYRITGLDHTEKVRAGDNLARICKRTLGPGMECYLEVFNGIKGDAGLKAGQEIKIPKLELKRKKARK